MPVPIPLPAVLLCVAIPSQRQEAFEESLLVSSAIFSAIRRCPALARDESILPAVLLGCCSENPLAARHAFAVLADQAMQSPDMVSQVRVRVRVRVTVTTRRGVEMGC